MIRALQAVWSRMKGSPLPLLSLLHSTSLTSITSSGVLDCVPLPWEAAGLFAIPGGLLLQGKEEGRASLLTLMKPQGELMEVSLEGREEDWGRAIWSSAETPLVVTYHSSSQRHALWRLEGDCCLKCCWQQDGRAAQAEGVVVWEDSRREAVVGLLDPHLQSLLCVIPSQPPWHLPALAAAVITPPTTRVPWSNVPPQKHLLVLGPAMRLTLYAGRCAVWSGSAPPSCVGLRDGVGDRVTLVRRDGEVRTWMERWRVRCGYSTPLVTSCLASIAARCPPLVHARLVAALMGCGPHQEWERLCGEVVGWMGEIHPPSPPTNWWERVMAKRGRSPPAATKAACGVEREGLLPLLLSLHALHLDLLRDCLRHHEAESLALLLAPLAGAVGEVELCDGYQRHFPSPTSRTPPLGPLLLSPTPLPAPALSWSGQGSMGLPELERLPLAASLPLYCSLQSGQPSCPVGLAPSEYLLAGREDLAAQCSVGGEEALLAAAAHSLPLRAAPLLQSVLFTPPHLPGAGEGDGLEHLFVEHSPQRLRFRTDARLREVRHLLGSARPVPLRMGGPGGAPDPHAVVQQQTRLWLLAKRTAALPVGRAALAWATRNPMLTEALTIPKLVLDGRLPAQNNATMALDGSLGSIPDLTRWPEFHNGCAAGLALRAEAGGLSRTWIGFNRSAKTSKEAHAGLLLALGLQGQLATLAPTDIYSYLAGEVGIEEVTTVGVVLGMAAAKRGSCDPALSKMLYLHLPSRHPSSFPLLDLPSPVQAASLVSMGLLYQATQHRLTTETLLAELDGAGKGESESYALSAGLALGLVTLGCGGAAFGLTDLNIEQRLQRLFSSAPHLEGRAPPARLRRGSVVDSELEHRGTGLNVSLTAPGALMALALMYLKTNDASAAARISLPETRYALDLIRPDFLLLRTLARGLILWDKVEATQEWVDAQLPLLVRGEGSASCHLLAGACMVLGLRFAGTAHAAAHQLLERHLLFFLAEKRSASLAGAGLRGSLEMCVGTCALAMSLVMAGSGHLPTLRLLRSLLQRTDPQISYGHHMALSLALGLLFLGGGMGSVSRSHQGLAALLIALYPRFPTDPTDNRCHLQALRHLWVLAARVRSCEAVDVDTGVPLVIPTRIRTRHSPTPLSCCTPCLLPDHPSLVEVEVVGPHYWAQKVQRPTAGLVVKRRAGPTITNPVLLAFSRHLAPHLGGSNKLCSALLAACTSADHPGVLHICWTLYRATQALQDGGKSGSGTPALHLCALKALVELKGRMPIHFPSHLVALVEESVEGWIERKGGGVLLGEYILACTSDAHGRLTMPMEVVREARSPGEMWLLACLLIWKDIPGPAAMRRVNWGAVGSVSLPMVAAAMPGATPAALTCLAHTLGQRRQEMLRSM